jgi:hypothetical protein
MLSNVVLRLVDDALENQPPTLSDEFARHEGLIFQGGLKSLLATIAETAALGADAGLTGLRSLHHIPYRRHGRNAPSSPVPCFGRAFICAGAKSSAELGIHQG